jgi:hypothetical protein
MTDGEPNRNVMDPAAARVSPPRAPPRRAYDSGSP